MPLLIIYMMNRYGNRGYGQAQQGRNQPLRPLFEPKQLQNYGIWLELIPHQIKMIVTQFGTGPTPQNGQFIRLKQFIYLDNMALIKGQRVTYPFGRTKTLPGLQICMAMCRQGFKARCFISSNYAYGNQKISKIPANSSIVIDIQILGIFNEPVTKDQFQDKLLMQEIKCLAKEGDELVEKGDLRQAQLKFQESFMHIQSTRCKEIKYHLYNPPSSKQTYHNRNHEEMINVNRNLQKERLELVSVFKVFDMIKVKTVEIALLNRDYYKVLILSKQCLMESRLELNQRILVARGRAFAQVGEFKQAIDLARHLCDKHSQNTMFKEELMRIEKKKEIFDKEMTQKMEGTPVLTFLTDEKTLLKMKKREAKKKVSKESKIQEET